MERSHSVYLCALSMGASMMGMIASQASAQSHYATQVVSYDPGVTPTSGYTDSAVALGTPQRMTGEGTPFLGAVTMFNAPWGTDEIVSIGEGGHLTLHFDRAITDDPGHLYGQDMILFGHPGFMDTNYPNGQLGTPAGVFGNDDAVVEVSADGANFFPVTHRLGDGLFPTQGYFDVGPYDTAPGSVLSDFLVPMDPALTLADFDGLSYAQALALYGASGGGTPVDIASTGLTSVRYVRISVLDDGNPTTGLNFELDSISVVPEPATIMLTLAVLLAAGSTRRRLAIRYHQKVHDD